MSTTAAPSRFGLGRLVLTLFGLVLLVIGMALGANNWYFLQGAEKAVGTVKSVEYVDDAALPTILFTDSSGELRLAKTNIASTSYKYPIGTEVPILYNFAFDEEVRIEGWLNSWLTGLVPGFIGLWILSRARRRVRNAAAPATAKPWADAPPVPEPAPDTAAMSEAQQAEAKQALINAIVGAAGKGPAASVRAAARSAVAAATSRAAHSVQHNRPPAPPSRKHEPTVRRMR